MFLLRLVALPVTAPTNGIMQIFKLIRDEVDKDHVNPEALRAQLTELQSLLEAGAIDEETYMDLEDVILDKLDELYDDAE